MQSESFSCGSRLHTYVSKEVNFRDEGMIIPVSDGKLARDLVAFFNTVSAFVVFIKFCRLHLYASRD